ncbi:MAG: hypothetical protein B6241_11705 [Spirochaetaceae bacterium 4572_59]|nr:MAG: hypothetical protein B6241_11705 [Spirochaetaceae bacterium 4572_59]
MNCKTVVLENRQLKLEVLPFRGGKISSLQDKRNGAQWFYRGNPNNPGFPDPNSYKRGVFDEKEAFGMDEMFPSINPEKITNYGGELCTLPDHGEVWSKSWDIISQSPLELNLTVQGLVFPYRFSRDILLEENHIILKYRAQNTGDQAIPALWTPHPLFSFYEETEILVPRELNSIRQAMKEGPLGEYGSIHALNASGEVAGVGNLLHPGTLPEGSCFKFYGDKSLKEGYCGLKDRRGSLTLSYPSEQISWLGFWINRGGWGGQQNLALEPATSPMDGPQASADFNVPSQLDAGELLEWEMVLAID